MSTVFGSTTLQAAWRESVDHGGMLRTASCTGLHRAQLADSRHRLRQRTGTVGTAGPGHTAWKYSRHSRPWPHSMPATSQREGDRAAWPSACPSTHGVHGGMSQGWDHGMGLGHRAR